MSLKKILLGGVLLLGAGTVLVLWHGQSAQAQSQSNTFPNSGQPIDYHSYVSEAQQNFSVNGTAVTSGTLSGFPTDPTHPFTITPSARVVQWAPGTSSCPLCTSVVPVTSYSGIGGIPPIIQANTEGTIDASETDYKPGLRQSVGSGKVNFPQYQYSVTGPLVPNTNMIAGPNGTALKSATIMCNGTKMADGDVVYSIVSTVPAIVATDGANGMGTAGFELPMNNNCVITYNFENPSNATPPPLSGQPPAAFSGTISITPANAWAQKGSNGTADYTVKVTSTSGYNGAINVMLNGTCPASSSGGSCTFPSGSSGTLNGSGATYTTTFRVTYTSTMAAGSFPFKITAAPTASVSDSRAVTGSAQFSVYVMPTAANANNHAQFVRYENVPSSLNPGQSQTVSVVMKNDGGKPWTPSTNGSSICTTNPPSNGYYLHSADNSNTWGVQKVALDDPASKNVLASIPAARYYRIRSEIKEDLPLFVNLAPAALSNITLYDSAGNAIPYNYWGNSAPQVSGYASYYKNTNGAGVGTFNVNPIEDQYVFDLGSAKTLSNIRFTVGTLYNVDSPQVHYAIYIEWSNNTSNPFAWNAPYTTFQQFKEIKNPGTYSLTQVDGTPGYPVYKSIRFTWKANAYGWYDSNGNPTGGAYRAKGAVSDITFYDQDGNVIPPAAITSATANYVDGGSSANYAVDGSSATSWKFGLWGTADAPGDFNQLWSPAGYQVTLTVTFNQAYSISKVSVNDSASVNLSVSPAYARKEIAGTNMTGFGATWTTLYGGIGAFGSGNPAVPFVGGTQREVVFKFTITAPTTPGTYAFQWKMNQECVEAFDNATALQNITVNGGVGPGVDLKVHVPSSTADPGGAAGASVYVGDSYELTWTTQNSPTSCTASGDWSGSKAAGGGSEVRSDSSSSGGRTYTISCTKNGITVSKSVGVYVNATPTNCNPDAAGDNQFVGCVWQWDDYVAGQNGISFNPSNFSDSAVWNLVGTASSEPAVSAAGATVPDSATALDRDWGSGGPLGLTDHFVVIWKGNFNFKTASYQFTSGSNDGRVVYLGNSKIIDSWSDQSFAESTGSPQVTTGPGKTQVIYYYYDNTGSARASLKWNNISGPPGMVQNLQAIAGQCKVTLSWNAPSGGIPVSAYRVSRSATSSSGPWTDIATSTVTSYTDNGPTMNVVNYYRVTAFNGAIPGPDATASATPNCPPGPPGGVTISIPSSGPGSICGAIDVKWNDVSGATEYYIYRRTVNTMPAGGGPGTTGFATTVPDSAGPYTFTDSGLSTGTYYYWVSAHNSAGESSLVAADKNSSGGVTVTECGSNLSTSDKDIIKHGDADLPAPGACDNSFDLPPSSEIFRIGDTVTFRVEICNSSTNGEATNILVTDSLINLVVPSTGWNMSYGGTAISEYTGGGNPPSGYFKVTGSVPNQVLIINLPGTLAKASAANNPTVKNLIFDAKIQPPTTFTSNIGRFQNKAVIQYDRIAGSGARDGTKTAQTGLVYFYDKSTSPKIFEIAPK